MCVCVFVGVYVWDKDFVKILCLSVCMYASRIL